MNKLIPFLAAFEPVLDAMRPSDFRSDVPKECWGRKIEAVRDSRHDPKIGRNDLCPCGSGKKYKHCCMK